MFLSKCRQYGYTKLAWKLKSSLGYGKYFTIEVGKNLQFNILETLEDEPSTSQNVAALIRKYCDSLHLKDIAHINDQLTVVRFSQPWTLVIERGQPLTLSLIDSEGKSYFRMGSAGVFTKPKQSEYFETIAKLSGTSILNEVLKPRTHVDKKSSTDQIIFSPLQRQVRDKLARKLKTVRKAYERQKKITPSLEITQQVRRQAESIEGKDMDKGFRLAKKTERAHEEGIQRLQKIEQEIRLLESDLQKLRTSEQTVSNLQALIKTFRIDVATNAQKKAPQSSKETEGRIFYATDRSRMIAGRSAAENDIITKKARSDDYWFHAVNAAGSHVIIPKKFLPKSNLSAQTLREGCILALHFSKLAESRAGEVYVTTRQHLRKQKGMPAGLWQVLSCETLFVRYEQNEIDQIFKNS